MEIVLCTSRDHSDRVILDITIKYLPVATHLSETSPPQKSYPWPGTQNTYPPLLAPTPFCFHHQPTSNISTAMYVYPSGSILNLGFPSFFYLNPNFSLFDLIHALNMYDTHMSWCIHPVHSVFRVRYLDHSVLWIWWIFTVGKDQRRYGREGFLVILDTVWYIH